MNSFKVEIRKDCKVCGATLGKRFRTFCSSSCRNKFFNSKFSDQHKAWQQRKRGEYASHKIQCLDCGKWYVQIGTHVIEAHGYESAREYKVTHDLEVKKGVVPSWYREMKGKQAIENGTYENLLEGAKYWFSKGQKGVGIYKRSHITVNRLKELHKYVRKNKTI